MTTRAQVQLEWGTASELSLFTGVARQLVFDTTNLRLVVMMGTGPGAFTPMASESYVNTQIASIGAGLAQLLTLVEGCV